MKRAASGTMDAHNESMRTIRYLALLALVGSSACVENAAQESTMPEPVTVQGPPGGDQDPGYGYQQPVESDGYGENPGYAADPAQAQQAPDPAYDPAQQADPAAE